MNGNRRKKMIKHAKALQKNWQNLVPNMPIAPLIEMGEWSDMNPPRKRTVTPARLEQKDEK